jgi:NhaP-type Na+/H+ or K+/H+ antiporter
MTLAIVALVVIVVAALLSRRTGIATPLVLLVVGIVVSLIPGAPEIELQPEWILAGVLPPLLYASAVRVPVVDLRRNLRMIGWLSVTLVIVSALAVGALVHWLVPEISFAAGVALGAVVSPTDAVAATSIGKRIGLPHRLMTVLEGESLLNDASALVLLRTALLAVAGSFSLGDAVWEFATAVAVAVAIGLAVGWVSVWFRARLADPVLTTAVSFIVPFLAFLPAEEAGASGVVAVVVAGLVTGHRGARTFTARERSTEHTNWNTLQFLIENAVFLLMGLQLHSLLVDLDGTDSSQAMVALLVGLVLLLLLVLRVVFVAVQVLGERRDRTRLDARRLRVDEMSDRVDRIADQVKESSRGPDRLPMFRRRIARASADIDFYEREPITLRGGAVLAWAGMRGVVTLAAALTIGRDVPGRTALVCVAFGVAVVSLLLYGGTLPMMIRWMKVPTADASQERTELAELMTSLSGVARDAVGPLDQVVIDGQPIDPAIVERMTAAYERAAVIASERAQPAETLTARQQGALVRRMYLEALREALHDERAVGAYSTAVLNRAEEILDAEEIRLED